MLLTQNNVSTDKAEHFVAVAPLFEQLTDSHFPAQIRLTKEQLLESIRREIAILFETRSSFSADEIDQLFEQPQLSGIPGLRGLPMFEDSRHFERQCEDMIRAFEPRLFNPVVNVVESDSFRLILQIQGEILWNQIREKLTFSISVNQETL